MQNEIQQTWFFNQSPDEVWEYLTRPELIEQWLTKTDFQPVEGQKFHFTNKSGKLIYCTVLEVKPFARLSYSWQFPSAKDKKLCDSKVIWTLVEKENGTELQLVHNGFVLLEDHAAHTNGWNICLTKLKELLKAGDHASPHT
jgi:uncharacterized protein YndB with AHSA1/START domain